MIVRLSPSINPALLGGPLAFCFARFIGSSPSFVAEQEITTDEASIFVFVCTETVHEHG